MIIKFFNGDDIIIGDDRGDKIKAMIQGGAEWLDINGGLYKVSNISAVLPSKNSTKMIGGVAQKRNMLDRLLTEEEMAKRLGQ